jgi:hypothetical protein
MVKKIFNSICMGLIGLTIGIVGSPIIAIAAVVYMTKVCVQLGYYGVDSLDEIKELKDE